MAPTSPIAKPLSRNFGLQELFEVGSWNRADKAYAAEPMKRPRCVHRHGREHSRLRASEYITNSFVPLNCRPNLRLGLPSPHLDDALKFIEDQPHSEVLRLRLGHGLKSVKSFYKQSGMGFSTRGNTHPQFGAPSLLRNLKLSSGRDMKNKYEPDLLPVPLGLSDLWPQPRSSSSRAGPTK